MMLTLTIMLISTLTDFLKIYLLICFFSVLVHGTACQIITLLLGYYNICVRAPPPPHPFHSYHHITVFSDHCRRISIDIQNNTTVKTHVTAMHYPAHGGHMAFQMKEAIRNIYLYNAFRSQTLMSSESSLFLNHLLHNYVVLNSSGLFTDRLPSLVKTFLHHHNYHSHVIIAHLMRHHLFLIIKH